MTDLALTITRQPSLFAVLLRRLIVWLNEAAYVDAAVSSQFSPREWADLPIHHPIRDGRDDR